jgi:peptidoglycan hydrolase-like protein with peptidoglycan-binding domain
MLINLKLGSVGPSVMNLQTMLNHLQMSQMPLTVDGQFGPKTRSALIKFQTNNFLQADGVAGPITAQKISALVIQDISNP